jgi:hypothetical protein
MVRRRSSDELALRSTSSSSDVPVMKHKYGGTSGSTQGLRKLMTPARIAAPMDTSRFMDI